MNSFEYLRQAGVSESIKDVSGLTNGDMRLLHAALGLQTESAEYSDMLKRHIFYGARIDRINALEEMGDIMWYLAIVCAHFNCSIEQVMEANIAKLQFRYPEQFSSTMAISRDLETERQVLEAILNRHL